MKVSFEELKRMSDEEFQEWDLQEDKKEFRRFVMMGVVFYTIIIALFISMYLVTQQ